MGGDWKELYTAAQKGDLELVRYHIRMGIDPNYQHPEVLTTPLIESARLGHLEVVSFLLDNGADPYAKALFGGETALLAARIYKHKAVVRLLKSHMKE